MWILTEISNILASPLGSLVYHLILLLTVEAALGMAWGEWRRTRREQAQRLLFAMGGLIIVRVVHLVAGVIVALGWAEGWILLPSLERFADTASICLLGWAFCVPVMETPFTNAVTADFDECHYSSTVDQSLSSAGRCRHRTTKQSSPNLVGIALQGYR